MNPIALYDFLVCLSQSLLASEAGDGVTAEIARLEAEIAAMRAFPDDSAEAKALAVVLNAASRLTEAIL